MTEHNATGATRTEVAIRWVVFHAGELFGIGVPLLLAVAVAAWFALLAVMTGAWWVAHEIRDHQRRRKSLALRAAADRRWLNTQDTTTPPTETTTTEPRKEAHQ